MVDQVYYADICGMTSADDFISGSQNEISRLQQRAAARTHAWREERYLRQLTGKIFNAILVQLAEAVLDPVKRAELLREIETRNERKRLGWWF